MIVEQRKNSKLMYARRNIYMETVLRLHQENAELRRQLEAGVNLPLDQ